MVWKREQRPDRYKKAQVVLAAVLLVILVLVGLVAWFNFGSSQENIPDQAQSTLMQPEQDTPSTDQANEFDSIKLQKVVDDWINSSDGTASVVITSDNGKVLVSNDPDRVFFAASIYKLFVAYEGYKQIDEGRADPAETYLNGKTRLECLDLMIRESNSPCAEKLWNELGKADLNETLKSYGINNTSMTNISTTASDSARILVMVESGEGLSEESRAKYLDSMKTQDDLYRRGLPSGFSENVIVYNKVGWNEQKEWHDTAIVELSDGQKLVVVVFTENVGSKNISIIGTALESSLSTN
jgi:beta-lactamase class A